MKVVDSFSTFLLRAACFASIPCVLFMCFLSVSLRLKFLFHMVHVILFVVLFTFLLSLLLFAGFLFRCISMCFLRWSCLMYLRHVVHCTFFRSLLSVLGLLVTVSVLIPVSGGTLEALSWFYLFCVLAIFIFWVPSGSVSHWWV